MIYKLGDNGLIMLDKISHIGAHGFEEGWGHNIDAQYNVNIVVDGGLSWAALTCEEYKYFCDAWRDYHSIANSPKESE